MFILHPELQKGCIELGDFKLCKVLLMNDSQFPWFILVPRKADIKEIFQLSHDDQNQLLKESSFFSEQIHKLFKADKLNVAALGNMVPQLHIHHIVRYKDDPAWPAPIWGKLEPKAYSPEEIATIKKQFHELALSFGT